MQSLLADNGASVGGIFIKGNVTGISRHDGEGMAGVGFVAVKRQIGKA
jgi:hypothetical protein